MGQTAYGRAASTYVPLADMPEVPSNQDLLEWFEEDERKNCSYCRERACVGLPEVPAEFCFAC